MAVVLSPRLDARLRHVDRRLDARVREVQAQRVIAAALVVLRRVLLQLPLGQMALAARPSRSDLLADEAAEGRRGRPAGVVDVVWPGKASAVGE